VHHCPDRLIALEPELALDLFAGEALFGRAQQEDGLVPRHEGQLRAFHDGPATQGDSRLAGLALIAPLVDKPIMVGRLAAVADHSMLITLFFEMQATALFISEFCPKGKYVHV